VNALTRLELHQPELGFALKELLAIVAISVLLLCVLGIESIKARNRLAQPGA
jgi:hypothetical protein